MSFAPKDRGFGPVPRVTPRGLTARSPETTSATLLTSFAISFCFLELPGRLGSEQRYACPRCCSSFSKKANMLTHFRYECGKEPRFQCPYCGKRDRKSSNTYRHIRKYHKGNCIQAYKLY
ncbi:hypothetical protein KM043_007661 [Ampulex compressa]|nr:hypothetical protein KM043_007661 [Ampulex compressa]